MNKTAILFCNGVSSSTDTNKQLYNNFDCAKQVFDEADSAFNGIKDICLSDNYNGDDADLVTILQSLAFASAIKSSGVKIDCVAGYDVGEYSALSYSGIVSISDAIKLITERDKIVKKTTASDILRYEVDGLDNATIYSLCSEMQSASVVAYNTQTSALCSCDKMAADEFLSRVKSLKGKCEQVYESNLFLRSDGTKDEFKSKLTNVRVKVPKIKVYANRTGKPYQINRDAIISNIVNQITSPIRWSNIVSSMLSCGIDCFLVIGAGDIAKYVHGAKVYSVNDIRSLTSVIGVAQEQAEQAVDAQFFAPNVRIA